MPAPAAVGLADASTMSAVGRLLGSPVPAAPKPEPDLRRSRAALRAAIVAAGDVGASTAPSPAATAGVRGSGSWPPSTEARLLPDPEVRFLPSLHVEKGT